MNSKDQKKKDAEMAMFQSFIRLHGGLNLSNVIPSERPDILANQKGKRIGIEIVTSLDPKAKQTTSEQDKIVERAEAIYVKGHKPPLRVSIAWGADDGNLKADREHLVSALVETVIQNTPEHFLHIDLGSDLLPFPLSEKLCSVGITRLEGETDNLWFSPRGGFQAEISRQNVQDILDKKETRVKGYEKKAYDEVWLLVVHDGFDSFYPGRLNSEALDATYQSTFDRIFFLTSYLNNVVELRKGDV